MTQNYKLYKDFKYWFRFIKPDHFEVVDKEIDSVVMRIEGGMAVPIGDEREGYDTAYSIPSVLSEFEDYKSRPEYCVYTIQNLDYSCPQSTLVQEYETKLSGCAMIRARRNGFDPDEVSNRLEDCLTWLRNGDFYIAPASTRFHDSQPFGLLKHSLDVADKVVALCDVDSFKSVLVDEAVLCALVHDWCKIGLYEPYQRNVKNERGQWVQVQAYNRGVSKYPLGHGEASMWLASKFFKLSLEECLAIRYHMGRWNISQDSLSELQVANESYPMVHMLQFADQLAIVKY